MRWCYKTVHYDLKKEGFLGSSFLDEAEVEQSLNEYGQSGWELISVIETQDGLIAVFKQPLDPVAEPVTLGRAIHENELYEELDYEMTENDLVEEEPAEKPTTEEASPKKDDDLYSIRIE